MSGERSPDPADRLSDEQKEALRREAGGIYGWAVLAPDGAVLAAEPTGDYPGPVTLRCYHATPRPPASPVVAATGNVSVCPKCGKFGALFDAGEFCEDCGTVTAVAPVVAADPSPEQNCPTDWSWASHVEGECDCPTEVVAADREDIVALCRRAWRTRPNDGRTWEHIANVLTDAGYQRVPEGSVVVERGVVELEDGTRWEVDGVVGTPKPSHERGWRLSATLRPLSAGDGDQEETER